MSDDSPRGRSTSSRSVCGPWAIAAAIRSATRCAIRCRRSTRSRCWPKPARGASTCTTTTSCRSMPLPPNAIASSENSKRLPAPRLVVPMATVNLFYDPVFRDGAFTANDSRVRAYALQKTMRAMDLGAELGAGIFVLWGGREGTETDACRASRRGDQAAARGGELPLRVFDRPQVRVQVRARGEAERAARRHLHGDDRRVSRFHPDARSSGNGRREPGSGARADGGAELSPRRRPGVGSGEAVSHRSERPGVQAATTRTSASGRRT